MSAYPHVVAVSLTGPDRVEGAGSVRRVSADISPDGSAPGQRVTSAMVARSRGVAEPRWSPDGGFVAWRDSFDGRSDVLVAPADGSGPPVIATADVAVAGAGAYGGGAFDWASEEILVVAADDGRLVAIPAVGGPPRVLSRDGRAFAPAVSPDGSRVAFCIEREDACDVAVVPLDGSEWPVRLSEGVDFAWDPTWSPDGRVVAWHEWDLPDMPWDSSRIAAREVEPSGSPLCGVRILAGGDGVATGQPRFSPDGGLIAFTSDAGGWSNVWVASPDGSDARPALSEESEHAEPSWGPGQRSYAWSPDGAELAWCRNEAGFGRLVIGRPGKRSARELAKGWHRHVDWGPGGIAAVRSGARTPAQVVILAADGSARRSVARGPVGGFEAAGPTEPEAVTWRSGNATVHGLLWRPQDRGRSGTGKPPMLVIVHGGPTGQALADWNPRAAYWLDRGWTVLAPDYRGSTGHGREYAQALAGRWGELDVADVAAGIRNAGRRGWCDPKRVAVSGGSAGGLTVLLLCALHGELVNAGVSLFGVTDLFELAASTHRFESRYLDRIVGVLPADADRYRDRSPVTHASKVEVPVLVLQGSDDKVVPQSQADSMVDAMRKAGANVEYKVYEGEGHGFRRPANVADELERTEAFLRRWVLLR